MDPDSLIEPSIRKAAKLAKAEDGDIAIPEIRSLTVEEMGRILVGIGWADGLATPTLERLARLLKFHPELYWHPLVERQIHYLERLRVDESEWQKLGWQYHREGDGEYWAYTPPREVAAVDRHLTNLIEAHASGLLPRMRIEWKPARRQPGQKGELKNPYPSGEPFSDPISAWWLRADFNVLRDAFKDRLRRPTGKPSTKDKLKNWYRELAQKVLQGSSVGAWSAYKDSEDGVARWKPLKLEAALEDVCQRKTGRDGIPAFLAYAVLGSLLNVTPKKIRNTIDNCGRPRRIKKSR